MSTDISDFLNQVKELELGRETIAQNLAESVAETVVNHARSLTSETTPGVKAGEGSRRLHPGGWADITGNLANSIKSSIDWQGLTVTATIEAGMEYAEYLDALEGIDVLGGADQIIRRTVQNIGDLY